VDDAQEMQKRASLARAGYWRRSAPIVIGLSLVIGASVGGISVATERQCSGEARMKVSATLARNGPEGTSAEYSEPSDGLG
jgi:hypothetical protein